MNPVQDELLSALARLYETGKYSDLTIICQAQRYHVHKALLCSRSHFFDGACSGQFQESRSGEIDMSEEDDEVVKHLINYFYYQDYNADEDTSSDVTLHQTAFRPSLADRPRKLDMSMVCDPLMAVAASALSPPNSRSVSPDDAFHTSRNTFASANVTSTLPTNTTAPRTPRPLSRRTLSLHRLPPITPPPNNTTKDEASNLPTPAPSHQDPDDMSDTDMDFLESSSLAMDEPTPPTAPLLLHARLYSAAEKYGIPALKILSKQKFETLLFPPSLESFNAGPLSKPHERAVFLTEDFPAAMEEVYTGTVDGDRGLRNAIVQAFRAHPEWAGVDEVGQIVGAYEGLGWDLHRVSNGIPVPF